jgi:hypothetical protein
MDVKMKKRASIPVLIILLMILTPIFAGNASLIIFERILQVARLTGGDGNQSFGYRVAISGDILAVGDPYDDQHGMGAGSVTIYQANLTGHWSQVTRLIPQDFEPGILFGHSLSLYADRLVVGAPGDNDFGKNSGSIYIFERNQGGPDSWGQVAKLTASDAYTNDQFGWAVSVDGDTIAAGAYTKTYGGRVYIFERDAGGPGQWGETAQLNPDPPGFQACFGVSVDMAGDLLAVGAYGGGDYSGSAYVFQRQPESGEWLRLTRFQGADTYAYHYFGYSVAIDNWTVLAGAPGFDGLRGAAYIFTADPTQPYLWTEQAELTAADGVMEDYFGYQLELSDDVAWVGAPMKAGEAGSVYIFNKDQGGAGMWGQVSSIVGDDTLAGDAFSYSISIDGHLAAVGAPGNLPHGSAYIFDFDPPWQTHLPLVQR